MDNCKRKLELKREEELKGHLEEIICKLAQRNLTMGNMQDRLRDKEEYVISSKV